MSDILIEFLRLMWKQIKLLLVILLKVIIFIICLALFLFFTINYPTQFFGTMLGIAVLIVIVLIIIAFINWIKSNWKQAKRNVLNNKKSK